MDPRYCSLFRLTAPPSPQRAGIIEKCCGKLQEVEKTNSAAGKRTLISELAKECPERPVFAGGLVRHEAYESLTFIYLTFEPNDQQQNQTPKNDQKGRNQARLGYSCANEFLTDIGKVAGMNKPSTPKNPKPKPIAAHTMRKRLNAVSWYVHSCAGGSTVKRSSQGKKAEQWQKLLDKPQPPSKKRSREQATPSELAEAPDGHTDAEGSVDGPAAPELAEAPGGEGSTAAELNNLRECLAEKERIVELLWEFVMEASVLIPQNQQRIQALSQQSQQLASWLEAVMLQASMAAPQGLQQQQQAAFVPEQGTEQGVYQDVYYAC